MEAISDRIHEDRKFQAGLHDKQLLGDDSSVRPAASMNRSYGAMERMKQRRRARGVH